MARAIKKPGKEKRGKDILGTGVRQHDKYRYEFVCGFTGGKAQKDDKP